MARLPRRAVGEGRPRPPAEWLERTGQSGLLQLQPAPELLAWALDSIVAGSGPVNNPDHVHLADADLAFAWASTGFQKAGRTVLGQAEQVMFRAGGWQKGLGAPFYLV